MCLYTYFWWQKFGHHPIKEIPLNLWEKCVIHLVVVWCWFFCSLPFLYKWMGHHCIPVRIYFPYFLAIFSQFILSFSLEKFLMHTSHFPDSKYWNCLQMEMRCCTRAPAFNLCFVQYSSMFQFVCNFQVLQKILNSYFNLIGICAVYLRYGFLSFFFLLFLGIVYFCLYLCLLSPHVIFSII